MRNIILWSRNSGAAHLLIRKHKNSPNPRASGNDAKRTFDATETFNVKVFILNRQLLYPSIEANSIYQLKILYPDSHDRNVNRLIERHIHIMRFATGEWCKPHMRVILSAIDAVGEVRHHSRILWVPRQNIDVRRISSYLSKVIKTIKQKRM